MARVEIWEVAIPIMVVGHKLRCTILPADLPAGMANPQFLRTVLLPTLLLRYLPLVVVDPDSLMLVPIARAVIKRTSIERRMKRWVSVLPARDQDLTTKSTCSAPERTKRRRRRRSGNTGKENMETETIVLATRRTARMIIGRRTRARRAVVEIFGTTLPLEDTNFMDGIMSAVVTLAVTTTVTVVMLHPAVLLPLMAVPASSLLLPALLADPRSACQVLPVGPQHSPLHLDSVDLRASLPARDSLKRTWRRPSLAISSQLLEDPLPLVKEDLDRIIAVSPDPDSPALVEGTIIMEAAAVGESACGKDHTVVPVEGHFKRTRKTMYQRIG